MTKASGALTTTNVPSDTTANETFTQAGTSIWPGDNPHFNLQAHVFRVRIYGTPTETVDPVTHSTTYTPHVAFAFYINANIVDAVGSLERAAKEYVASKSGSPASINYPFATYNTRRGTVRQTWLAGQGYAEAKAIPLATSANGFVLNGSGGLGYTQQLNIDFDAGDDPGHAFFEGSFLGSGLIGNQIGRAFSGDATSPTRFVAGVDYRAGIQLGGSKPQSISINGTAYFSKVVGQKGTISLSFAKSVQ